MNNEILKCGCGGKINSYFDNWGCHFICLNPECNFHYLDKINSDGTKATAAFRLATRVGLDKLRASDAIKCPDENCCGCLVEGMVIGEIHCNECGKRYELKPIPAEKG